MESLGLEIMKEDGGAGNGWLESSERSCKERMVESTRGYKESESARYLTVESLEPEMMYTMMPRGL